MIVIRKLGSAEDSTFAINRTTGQLEETLVTGYVDSGDFTLDPLTGELQYGNDPEERGAVFGIDDNGYLTTYTSARFVSNNLVYSGTFMDIPFITLTVKTHAPLDWQIGDYIIWDYDGLTYTLKELPQVYKQATTDTYGEAYVYEGVKFMSELQNVKYAEFLDIVPAENNLHFTSLPQVSFTGNVSNLIDRINANLTRLYANWIVQAADVTEGEVFDAMQEMKLVETNNVSCWDALGLFYSLWGLGFTYYYDTLTSKHTIVVGATGGATGNFAYGQGNGLYIIGKAINKEDSVVTRLRAYGSTRNLPSRYYNTKEDETGVLIANEFQYIPNLMIPYTKWGQTAGRPDVLKAFIDCNNTDVDPADTAFAKYGIREKSVFFDGSNNNKEIYPTIENLTAGEMRAAILAYTGDQVYVSPNVAYLDAERLDKIKVGDTITDDGMVVSDLIYSETVTYAGDTGVEYMGIERQLIKTFNDFYTVTLDNDGTYNVTVSAQSLLITSLNSTPDYGEVQMWLIRNGQPSYLIGTIQGESIANGLEFPLINFKMSAQEPLDSFAIRLIADVHITAENPEDLAVVNWEIESGTMIFTFTRVIPANIFTMELKQVGFDIIKYAANSGVYPSISMTSGACTAREFIIKGTEYKASTDSWIITCVRQSDTTLKQWFPNSYYHIAAEDSFVLLNINMPEILIDIAEERVYDEGCKWLLATKRQKYVYEPKVDEVYMALNPQVIKEGMMMPVADTDLGIDESVIINSITITETEDKVRTFDVVLREDAETDILKYLANQNKEQTAQSLKTVVNAVTSTTQSAADMPVSQDDASLELGYVAENVLNKVGTLNANSTVDQYVNAKALYDLLPHYSNGVVVAPSITDNGDGSVTIGTGTYCLSAVVTGSGFIRCYQLVGGTFTLVNLAQNYIVADYNSGTPIVKLISDVTLISETTVVPVFTIFRNGIYLHTQWWDTPGLALSNKVHQSIVKTQRYRRESGLSLSEYGTRNISITAGRIWIGAVPMDLSAILTATDPIFFWYHSAGAWTTSVGNAYENIYYDNGTNVAELTPNRYAVNWVFRGVESQKHTYIVFGTGDYTISQATAATVPAIPTAISSHAVLVGKIVIQKGAATATSIQSAFDIQFSYATPSAHNDTTGIQGGAISEYYHLSAAQATVATQSATSLRNGFLSAADWATFYSAYEYAQVGHLPLGGGTLTGAVTSNSSFKGTKGIFTTLTDTCVPYHKDDTDGLVDSPISITDAGTNVHMGNGKVTMAENINTRLRIPIYNPSSPPTGLTTGEYYLYILE